MTIETHTHIHTRGCHYFFGALRQLGQGSVVALNGDVRHRLLCLFYLSGRSVRPIDCDASKAGQGKLRYIYILYTLYYAASDGGYEAGGMPMANSMPRA